MQTHTRTRSLLAYWLHVWGARMFMLLWLLTGPSSVPVDKLHSHWVDTQQKSSKPYKYSLKGSPNNIALSSYIWWTAEANTWQPWRLWNSPFIIGRGMCLKMKTILMLRIWWFWLWTKWGKCYSYPCKEDNHIKKWWNIEVFILKYTLGKTISARHDKNSVRGQ